MSTSTASRLILVVHSARIFLFCYRKWARGVRARELLEPISLLNVDYRRIIFLKSAVTTHFKALSRLSLPNGAWGAEQFLGLGLVCAIAPVPAVAW